MVLLYCINSKRHNSEDGLERAVFGVRGVWKVVFGENPIAMDVKRRRPNISSSRLPDDARTDYFDEIFPMHGQEDDKKQQSDPHNTRSSWLTNVDWISSNQDDTESSLPMSMSDKYIQTEIKHINMQLLQVKRRLHPAASTASSISSSCSTARQEFEEARRACNPYEILGEGKQGGLNQLFMNRSAIKLCNIDACLNWCLLQNQSIHDRVTFVDLCGAPGGFSEYLLWRSQGLLPLCEGHGMSLVGYNEQGQGLSWKLRDNTVHARQSFQKYNICLGVDGSGDIYNWENTMCLLASLTGSIGVVDSTNDRLAHVVVADGGFDSQRDATNQEELAQKLVVCETAAALVLMRKGGTLVIKMFGFQTRVIRTLMRFLFFSFDSLIALKPITSRPASAERYVICFGFHGLPSSWNCQRWCSEVFLGCLPRSPSEKELALYSYLDTFDCHLLSLNLKACFSILSYLERKVASNEHTRCKLVESAFSKRLVDITAYINEWHLN